MPNRVVPRFRPSLAGADFMAALGGLVHAQRSWAVVAEFEQRFARTMGVAEAVCVPSAREGLRLLLSAAGLPAGSEVLFPALTYWSMPAAAVRAGLRPRFVDIGCADYLIDPARLEAAITPQSGAIVPTHLYGCPCEMDAILAIARRRGLVVIEDCAQSCGARYRGRRTGGLGDAGVFTFGITKNFTTLFGGVVATNRREWAATLRREAGAWRSAALTAVGRGLANSLAMHAATQRVVFGPLLYPVIRAAARLGRDFVHEQGGEAATLSASGPSRSWHAIQASVGLRQLERLDANNAGRIRAGWFLADALAGTPGLSLPLVPDPRVREHIFMSFVVRSRKRDRFRRALLERGVDTAAGYMHNCAGLPLFREFAGECPVAAAFDREQVHLPVYPSLTAAELAHVAESVRAVARCLA